MEASQGEQYLIDLCEHVIQLYINRPSNVQVIQDHLAIIQQMLPVHVLVE